MKKFKKILAGALITSLLAVALAACGQSTTPTTNGSTAESVKDSTSAAATTQANTEKITLKIGASPVPHAEILAKVKEILAKDNIELEILEFTDYVTPNLALDSKEIDANFFQHWPYLDNFNQEKGTNLISVAGVHFEPLSIFAGQTKTLAELKDGAKVAVPNDTTNEARSLLLLQKEGLITLKEGAGLTATPKDIVENPKNLSFVEMEAASVARTLPDVDIAVINGNYALTAGLDQSLILASEDASSEAAQTYANILAVRDGDQDRPEIKALVAAITSDEIKTFIDETYKGVVVPVFSTEIQKTTAAQ